MGYKEIFKGADRKKTSSKRTLSVLITFIALGLWVDSHYSIRILNNKAFEVALYAAAALAVGGVLEGKFTKQTQTTPPSEGPEEDYK